ncbi:MAG: DUF4837 family protein [Flavobacteriaceae bacterium]|nr:DUF4837 family protein [Flavobacteriaceae bacterium]
MNKTRLKAILPISLMIFLIGCKSETQRIILADSFGNINNILVVLDEQNYQGELGDSIRSYFTQEVEGLPRSEPEFSLSQVHPENFNELLLKQRNFMHFEKSEKKGIKVKKDSFAFPQLGIFIYGKDKSDWLAVLDDQQEQLRQTIKKSELKEIVRRFKKSPLSTEKINESIKAEISLPTAYRLAKNDEVIWLRKDIKNGDLNLLVYEVPLNYFEEEQPQLAEVIALRDSVGAANIPVDEGGTFGTELIYTPYFYKEEHNNREIFITKGIWEVRNKFLAGPFVNYIIKDNDNQRFLVAEGFVLAPSQEQRNYVFELEAIIRGIKIKQ